MCSTATNSNSPRGRIYLIKDMLEHDRPATAEVTEHIDRCLSCLACMTTCPSGVHYMHLVDHARAHIEQHLSPAAVRALAARAACLAHALSAALPTGACWRRSIGKPFAALLPRHRPQAARRHARSVALAHLPHAPLAAQVFPAAGPAKQGRVALLAGCVNDVLAPQINAAAIRVLTRHGIEVVVAEGAGCCGSLVHHMGRERRGAGAGARQYRRLAGDRGPRCHRDHHLGLRHHGEGLWLHAAHRFGQQYVVSEK